MSKARDIADLDFNAPDIDGGNIDGAVIGGTTPAAVSGTTGQFATSLNVDGTATVDGLTVDGTFLVGESANFIATSTTATGLAIIDDGRFTLSRSGTPMNIGRLGSDGSLVDFWRQGVNIGRIGVTSDRLVIGSGDTGLRFVGDADQITPWNTTTNSTSNGLLDLGNTNNKFKDIHLSGIANVPQLNLVNSAATQCLNVSRAGGGAVTNGATIVSGAVAKFNGNVSGSDALRIGSFDDGSGAYYIDVSNYNGTGAYDLVLNPYVGNVGIRVPDPATALHVAGNSSTRNNIASTLTIDGGVNVGNPYDGFGFGIDFIGRDYGNAVRNYAAIYSVMENQVSSSGGGDAGFKAGLRFYTNGGGASNTSTSERMRIDNLGAVKMTKGGTAFTPLLYDGLVIQSHDATGIRIIDAGNGGSNGGHCGIGNDNGHLQLSTAGDMMFDTGFEPTDQLYNGRHEKMRIYSAGQVTMPSQPSWGARGLSNNQSGAGTTGTNETLVFSSATNNTGNHYSTSTGIFTAPVAGRYFVTFSGLYNASDNTTGPAYIRHNSTEKYRAYHHGSGSYYEQIAVSGVLDVAANDTISIFSVIDGWHIGGETSFSGYLIG